MAHAENHRKWVGTLMTEHVVLSRATAYRAELERQEHVALLSLSAVRSERARVEQFLELYARFNAAPEPEEDEAPFVLTPDGWKHAEESQAPIQESAPLGAVVSDVVTPSSDQSVTGREGAEPAAPGNNSPETATESTASRKDVIEETRLGNPGGSSVGIATQRLDGLRTSSATSRPEVEAPKAGTQAQPVDVHPEDLHAQAAVEGIDVETAKAAPNYSDPMPPPVAEQMSQIRAAVEGPKKNVGGRPPNSKLRGRLLAFKADNPNAAVRDAAKALGVGSGSISVAAKALGISFPVAQKPPRAAPGTEKLRAILAVHPDWPATRIAEELGITNHAVNSLARYAGLTIRRLTAAERSAVRSPSASGVTAEEVEALPAAVVKELSKPAQRLKTEPVASKVASKVAPKVEEPLAFAGEADEADADYVSPLVADLTHRAPTNAKWFRLRRADGMWLHLSGHGFTSDKNNGWIGRIGQLRTARSRFDDAKGLQIVGVSAVTK